MSWSLTPLDMSWSLTPLEFGCGTDHCSIPVTNSCYHHSILIHGHLLYSRDLYPSKYGYSILHGQSVMPLSSLPPLHVLSGFALGTLAQLDLVYWQQPHLRQEHVHCVSVTSVCPVGDVIEHLLMVGWSADPFSYLLFQPVIHKWCNTECGMCCPICEIVHIKDTLLLIRKNNPWSWSSGLSFIIWVVLNHMPYNYK